MQAVFPPLTLPASFPKSFRNLFDNETYKQKKPFVGYGNPSAKILIVGQEVTWKQDIEEQKRYCFENFDDWQENIKKEGQIVVKSEIHHPDDDVCSEAFLNFNPIFPHYYRYNCLDNKKRITRENGRFTHKYLKYGASTTWYKYQKLVQDIFCREKSDSIDFFKDTFITELSEVTRPNNKFERDPNIDLQKQKKEEKKKREATKESIKNRCQLFKNEFFQQFPITIFACGHYADKIFEFIYGFKPADVFSPSTFKQNGYRVYRGENKIYVWTYQFSHTEISDAILGEIAEEVRPYLNK